MFKTPIIFIPGLGGSRLYSKWNYDQEDIKELEKLYKGYNICETKCDYWSQLWINLVAIAPNIISHCWQYRMEPLYNDSIFSDKRNIQVTAWKTNPLDENDNLILSEDFGGLKGVTSLIDIDQYQISTFYMFYNIIEDFKKQGYEELKNIFGAPYDFRKITSLDYYPYYFKSLKKLIEYSVSENNNLKTVIISHSLGCPTFKLFLSFWLPKEIGQDNAKIWKNKYIKKWIPLSGPFAGAPKALRTAISGDDEGFGKLCIKNNCNSWYKQMERTFSGLIWMIPDNITFSGIELVEYTNKEGINHKVYPENIEDLTQLLTSADSENSGLALKYNVNPLRNYMYLDPEVNVVAINGSSVNTEMSFVYPLINGTTPPNPKTTINEQQVYSQKITNKNLNKIMENTDIKQMIGDGTVPWISLNVPRLWNPKTTKILTFSGTEMEHLNMVNTQQVRNTVLKEVLEQFKI